MNVYLRKKFLESGTGQKFLNLLTSIVEDGKVTEEELDLLLVFLNEENENLPTDNPSIGPLKEKINDIYGDGVVDSKELVSLFDLLLKIIPKSHREPLLVKIKQIRKEEKILEDRRNYPPTEKQFNFIRSLGGDESHIEQLRQCSHKEVSNYIDELFEVRGPGPTYRQLMILKFWGKDKLKKFDKMSTEEISEWYDEWTSEKEEQKCEDGYHDNSWTLFKKENPHISSLYGLEGVDLVESGIGNSYLRKVRKMWKDYEKSYEDNFEDDYGEDDIEELFQDDSIIGDMYPDIEDFYEEPKDKTNNLKFQTSKPKSGDGCLVTFIGISLSFLTLVVCLLVKIFN